MKRGSVECEIQALHELHQLKGVRVSTGGFTTACRDGSRIRQLEEMVLEGWVRATEMNCGLKRLQRLALGVSLEGVELRKVN